MSNLSVLNTLVSASLRRQTSLDTQIPQMTAMAVQWLERNYTFKYMEQLRLGIIQSGLRTLVLPTAYIKAWKFFRIINADGSYTYLNKIEPEDLNLVSSTANTLIANSIPSGSTDYTIMPGNFYQVGMSQLVFDAVPSQNFNFEALFYGYSSWPTDPSTYPTASVPVGTTPTTFTHPLLNVAFDVVLDAALVYCTKYLTKDLRMLEVYKGGLLEGLNTLERAEDELKFGSEGMSMNFDPNWDWSQDLGALAVGYNSPPVG